MKNTTSQIDRYICDSRVQKGQRRDLIDCLIQLIMQYDVRVVLRDTVLHTLNARHSRCSNPCSLEEIRIRRHMLRSYVCEVSFSGFSFSSSIV